MKRAIVKLIIVIAAGLIIGQAFGYFVPKKEYYHDIEYEQYAYKAPKSNVFRGARVMKPGFIEVKSFNQSLFWTCFITSSSVLALFMFIPELYKKER